VTPLEFTLLVFGVSLGAGALGAVLGLGGGIIIVPALTLLLRIDIRYAIGASIVAVIATSSGAAAAYVRERMTNLRIAMFLEIGTTLGALTGAYLAGSVDAPILQVIFGVVMAYSAGAMIWRRKDLHIERAAGSMSDRLGLHGEFFDEATGVATAYVAQRPALGLGLMYVAGVVSGLLGIGSGALKVPAMDLAMGLPIKVSTATSNFMIGVTAAASAGVYFMRGEIDPFIAAPVALGVMIGATLGARLLGRLHSRSVRMLFVAVLVFIAGRMLWEGVRGLGA